MGTSPHMINSASAQDRCVQLLEAAKAAGADAADAVASAQSSESVTVRLGKLEDVERSEGEEIGLRVFVGKRSASVHTSDFSAEAFRELAERAVAMARLAPEDPYAGLAPREELMQGEPDLEVLQLGDGKEPGPEALKERALAAEDAARAVEGVTNSEAAGASFGRSTIALATSEGFVGGFGGSSHGLYSGVIAGEGSGMQRDYAHRTARYVEDLPTPEEIGKLAGDRAVSKLDPGGMPSRSMPVVFDPRIGGSLIGNLVGAMAATAAARRATFLLDKLDEEIFAPGITIVEEPLRPRGLRSRPFDGEGLPARRRVLVEGGKVTGWLTNVASARQLGLGLTGNASRGGGGSPGVSVGNVDLHAGELSRDALLADIKEGVYVTEMFGQGVNSITGDYSRGASGFRIVDGVIAGPVAEFTVAGNLIDMFRQLTPASDLETWRTFNVPTIRVDGMTVAGDAS